MKASKLLPPALAIFLVATASHGGNEVDRLLDEYAKIETVTCQIRRTKEGAAGKIKFLSRVYWTNENKLHAEGISPVKRRTIADGQRLWQYAEGDPKGFSRPIGDLSEEMTISLKMVPGTAMDHLLRLKGLEETKLPANDGAAKRRGIQIDQQFVVLVFDDTDRLIGIRFFRTPEMKDTYAEYRYSDFSEAIPGVWVPMTHEAIIHAEGTEFSEIVKVDRFTANQPIAAALFIPSSFFDKGIDFVDDFAKIYPK